MIDGSGKEEMDNVAAVTTEPDKKRKRAKE
jgi:hypothetical protein